MYFVFVGLLIIQSQVPKTIPSKRVSPLKEIMIDVRGSNLLKCLNRYEQNWFYRCTSLDAGLVTRAMPINISRRLCSIHMRFVCQRLANTLVQG